jgi:hypothetical protein
MAYTRDQFERLRSDATRVARREGWLLAAVSVLLGIAQLFAIAWMDRHLERTVRLAVESAVFLAYFALVIALLWRMQKTIRAARPRCPACGVTFSELSERVAAATGKCDACSGLVISDLPRTEELGVAP